MSLSGGLGEKLEAIAAAKFDAVEIFENDLLSYNGRPADVRKAVRDLGLQVVTLQPFRDFEGYPRTSAPAPSPVPSASSTPCKSWAATCS